ncbi:MAG: potassium channel family protein [Candidatus Aenigmatarchaeota archaeon]
MIRKLQNLWESKKSCLVRVLLVFGLGASALGEIRKGNGLGAFARNVRKVAQIKERNSIWRFIDNLNFKKLFVLWIAYIFVFSAFFFFLDIYFPGNGLKNAETGYDAISFLNSAYFSFVCATSTGFGDITPLGLSRTVAIVDVIGGMLIFGLVISKLVSFKQDMILDEIYEISLDEKVGALRSRLYLFRSDAGKLTERIAEGQSYKRRVDGLWILTDSLRENLEDIGKIVCFPNGRKSEFLKSVGPLQLELVLNSISMSLARLTELLAAIDGQQCDWRSKKNTESVSGVLSAAGEICGCIGSKQAPDTIKERLNEIAKAAKELETKIPAPAAKSEQ